jgi:hypothetical protein
MPPACAALQPNAARMAQDKFSEEVFIGEVLIGVIFMESLP